MALPTHLLVSATIKNALADGIYITVLKKGDPERGTLYVKVDNLSGSVKLYQQVFDGTSTNLALHSEGAAVDAAVASAVEYDPDAWVVEIDDRKERIWFDAIFDKS